MPKNVDAVAYFLAEVLYPWTANNQGNPNFHRVLTLGGFGMIDEVVPDRLSSFSFAYKDFTLETPTLTEDEYIVVYSTTYDNQSDLPQSYSFSTTHEEEETTTLTYDKGAKLAATLTPSIKIFSATFTGELNFAISQVRELKRKKAWTWNIPIQVPPKSKLKVHANMLYRKFSAPFTITYIVSLTNQGLIYMGNHALNTLPGLVPEIKVSGTADGSIGIDSRITADQVI